MTNSFNRQGNDGRLGNQMFQYAFLRGVAKNRDFDWMIPGDDDYSRHNYGLFDCFEMTGVKPENIGRTTNRTVECFDCLLYTSPSPRDLSTSRMPSSA